MTTAAGKVILSTYVEAAVTSCVSHGPPPHIIRVLVKFDGQRRPGRTTSELCRLARQAEFLAQAMREGYVDAA